MTKSFSALFNTESFFTGVKNKFNGINAKTILQAAPGFLTGMGSVMTVKAACAGATACIAAPGALGTLFAVAAAGIITGSAVCLTKGGCAYGFNRKASLKAGKDVAPFWSKRNFRELGQEIKKSFTWKTMGVQMLGACLGGLAVDIPTVQAAEVPDLNVLQEEVEGAEPFLDEQALYEESLSNDVTELEAEDIQEPADVQESETIVDDVLNESALDEVGLLFADGELDGTPAQEIYEAALSGDPQATKDLAFFLFNGIDCFPEDQALALELYQQAADAGNIQAQTDLAYIQYHGLADVTQDADTALEVMDDVGIEDPLDYWENPEPPLIDDICDDCDAPVPVMDHADFDFGQPFVPEVPEVVVPELVNQADALCDFQAVIVDLQKPMEFVCNMGPTFDVQAGDTIRIDAYMHLDNNGGAGSDIHFISTPIQTAPALN